MAFKLILGGLFAITLLGCLANAQFYTNLRPQTPQPENPNPSVSEHTLTNHQHHVNVRQGTCVVDQRYRIRCGARDISAADCNALSCCYDGSMCYYGKYVTLHCTKDAQIVMVVAKDATIPSLDLDSVSLFSNVGSCSPVESSSAFAIYQFPVTECGTIATAEEDTLIYENRMFSQYEVALGPRGAITRDSFFDLSIQCRYSGMSKSTGIRIQATVVPIKVLHFPVHMPNPAYGAGVLNVELRLGSGQCHMKGCNEEDVAFTTYYTEVDYPVTKILQENVYVEVRMLGRTDPNLVLTLGHCWATSNANPLSLPQWDLLIDGCPYREDRYQTKLLGVGSEIMFPSHYRRFAFQMFTFVSTGDSHTNTGNQPVQPVKTMVPLHEKVFIHCNVAVCQPTNAYSCEPRCFRKRRNVGDSMTFTHKQDDYLVSSQEIQFVAPSETD